MHLTIAGTTVVHAEHALALELVGPLDLTTRRALLDVVSTELPGYETLYLNLHGVDFIDAAGVGTLVEITHLAARRGATVTLVERSEPVERVLGLVGLGPDWPRLDAALPSAS
ncbi:MAG: anti-sigma factor antagonist [Marmoricola sp.]